MATLFTSGRFQLIGGELGTLETYAAGGTTPLATYTTQVGDVPNATTINLDANGRAAVWLGASAYRMIGKTSAGVTIYDVDNITPPSNSVALAAAGGSSLVGYEPTTSYVAGTIGHRLNAVISMGSFTGADPTGVTENTAQLALAIALGCDVFFPTGTWLIDATTLNVQGQMIHGTGAGSIIKAVSSANNLFTVTADYVTIRDLRLNGVATAATTSKFAIFTDTATPARSLLVERVLFSGASSGDGFTNGVKFDDDCNKGTVRECEFERLWGSGSGYGYGVLVGDASSIVVDGCRFLGSTGRGRHAVYFSGGGSRCKAINNTVESFDYEALTQYSTGAQPPCIGNLFGWNTLVSCCAAGGGSNAAIQVNGHSTGVQIVGNVITSSGARGIAMEAGSGITDLSDALVAFNIVRDSQLTGIDLIAATGGVLLGNEVHESGRASSGVSGNYRLKSDGTTASTAWAITGNKSSGTSWARSSLILDSTAPAPSDLKIDGNHFPVCVTAGVESTGVAVAIDGRIRYSTTYDPASIADGAALTSTYTVTGAAVGDLVMVTHSSDTDGCALTGRVSATDTVKVSILNNSGGAKDIATGTLYIDVWKRTP